MKYIEKSATLITITVTMASITNTTTAPRRRIEVAVVWKPLMLSGFLTELNDLALTKPLIMSGFEPSSDSVRRLLESHAVQFWAVLGSFFDGTKRSNPK